MVSVRKAQAQWAQHLLDQAGIPTESGAAEVVTDQGQQPERPQLRTPRRPRGRSRLWTLLIEER